MRGGEERDEQGLGVGLVALTGKVSALLGRALTALADIAWSGVFRAAELLEEPQPTPYEQYVKERERAITEYLLNHSTREEDR